MNNVQAQQFAALQKATATYQNETKHADHLRRREVDLLAREQESQRRLEEEVRAAHGAVGEEDRKRANLEGEGKRYKQAAEDDRRANVQVTSELRGIEADSKEQKVRFVKEMEALNGESDFLLTERERAKTSRLLRAEDATWLVETKLAALAGGEDAGGKWSEVAARVREEVAGLVEADERCEEAAREAAELEGFLRQVRAKFLAENGNFGQMEINDLESKWERQCEYGGGRDQSGDGAAMPEDGEHGGNAASGATTASPTHMELFYHDQEYAGPAVHDDSAMAEVGQAC